MSTEVAEKKQVKGFTLTSIIVISVVGFVSILLMLFGDFEGKGERVATTLILFAAFTGFSAYDGRKVDRPRYIQIAQIGSIYMMSLGLLLIWATLALPVDRYGYSEYYGDGDIFFRLVGLIILLRVGMFLLQSIVRFIDSPHDQVKNVAKVASAAVAIMVIMFTLPLALEPFFEFSDFYWRVAVSMLLVSALAISIGLLVFWALREKKQPQDKAGKQNFLARDEAPVNSPQRGQEGFSGAGNVQHEQREGQSVSGPQNAAQQYSPPVTGALPWPVFPSGQPLPARPNGRPDYQALHYMAAVFMESEKQWFGKG